MSASRLTVEMLQRWRADPCAFIEEALFDPETNKPFVLLQAERDFLAYALQLDADARLKYPELLYSAIKKSGKTGFGALFLLTVLLLYGGQHAEAYIVANDLDQATGRVFEAVRKIVEASPLLRKEAKVLTERIIFPATGATITALAASYASAAGGHPTIAVFDELWAYTSERSRRLFDELVPVPTRKISCRLTVTHAGFVSESALLEEMYQRGLKQPRVGTDLHAGDGLLMFWSHQPIAPWQTPAWLNEMGRSLRPNQYARMIENRFVSTDNPLIDLSYFDAVIDENYRAPMVDRELPVWIGVDASVRHDSTALVAVTWDRAEQRVRLVSHRIFTPSPNAPIDFENSIEQTIHTWRGRFLIRGVWFDPFQMVSSAQRLTRDGIRMTEFPQSLPNLTEASNNLLELIRSRRLLMYRAPDIRQAMARAVLIESARGSRIGKTTTSHHIDVVVAMAMACLAAVRSAARSRLRMGLPLGADGFGPVIQVDPVTLQPLNERRSRLVRDANGALRIAGGDNTCWTREELRRRRIY